MECVTFIYSICVTVILSFSVSKVTLDIICITAFGYESDSLHNPHNELAQAYENLVNLQSGNAIAKLFMFHLHFYNLWLLGANMARMIAFMHIPGFAKFMGSSLFRRIAKYIPGLGKYTVSTLIISEIQITWTHVQDQGPYSRTLCTASRTFPLKYLEKKLRMLP
jgi:hypothetical protein